MAKIGEIQIKTPSGIETIPIYEPGDSGSSISESLRVQTSSGTGFVPLAPRPDASFPEIAVQTDSGVLAATDKINSAFTYSEGFEDSSLSDWNVKASEFKIKSNNVFEGSFSAGIESSRNSVEQVASKTLTEGKKATEFEFYWYETSSSTGFSCRLMNSEGRFEAGFMSNNPQWEIYSSSGINQIYPGDGYDRWIRVRFSFDWEANSFSYTVEDLSSGTQKSGSADLRQGLDIKEIHLDDYSSGNFRDSFGNCYTWWDEFRLTTQ